MRKLIFLMLIIVLTGITGIIKAQVSAYTFSSTTGTYVPITGGTILRDGTLTMDSWVSGAITIPSFTFNGVAYTTAYVTSNGLLNLGGAAPSSSSYTAISTTTGSGISICPFNADLNRANSTAATDIRWEDVGNEIIFQWTQMLRYGATENFDFQVRLNKVTGSVQFVYQLNSGPGTSTSYQPQVGIRTSATDYNNRLVASGTEDWATSLPGTANNNTCRFTSTSPAKGFVSGLTFTWTAPTCFSPNTLLFSNITPSSVDISWTAPAVGTPVNYEWIVVAQGAGSGGTPIVSGSVAHPAVTANATGLTPSTAYDIFVRSDCGSGDYSGWAGPVTFTTACNSVSTFPWLESFTSTSLPSCWALSHTGSTTYDWTFVAADATNGAPSGVSGSGYFARLHSYLAPTANNPYNLTTPPIDLSSGNKQLYYYAWIGSASAANPIVVKISTDNQSTWTTLITHDHSTISTWFENFVNLSSYTSTNAYIRFEGYSNYGSGQCNFAIDEVQIRDIPACPSPSALNVTSVTGNSAILGWTLGGSETEWYIAYGAPGFDPAIEGTLINTGVTNPYVLSGLTSSTPYQYYVKAICGVGNESVWAGPVSFTTACGSTTAFPFTEGFEGGVLPACWSQEFVSGTANWTYVATNGNSTITPRTGTKMAEFRTTTTGNITKLITPPLDITSLTVPELTFYYANVNWLGDIDELRIFYKTSPSGSWTQIGDNYVTEHTSWTEVKLILPNPSSTYYVAFESTSNYARGLDLDDITIKQGPTCVPPTGIAVTNITTTGADLSWVAPTVGTPLNYEWLVVPQGAGYGGAVVSSGSTVHPTVTASATGFNPSTPYDVFVRTDCGGSDFSDWAGPYTFTTECSVYNAPFSETFEPLALGTVPICWNSIKIHNSTSAVAGAETSGSPYSTPNHIRMYNTYTPDVNAKLMVVTPELNDITSCRIRFYAKASTANEPLVIGTITDPSDPATFTALQTISNLTTTHAEYIINLDTYAGTDTYIAFSHGNPGTGNGRSVYIDNFVYEVIPTCFDPTGVTLANITTSSVDISWTAPTQGTPAQYGWMIVLQGQGPTGTPVAQGIVPHPTTTVTATGLNASTAYELWMRTECGGGDYSNGVGPIVFTTQCAPFNLPYTQNFDGTTIPTCWSQTYSGALTSNRWSVNLGNEAGGTPNEMMASFQNATGISRLITPAFNTSGVTNLMLSFMTMYNDYGAGANIKIQSSADGINWTDEGIAYPSGSGDIPAGTIFNVPIHNNLGGTTYLAWVIDGNHFQYDYWYIDNVVVKEPSSEAEILTFTIPTQVSSDINSTNATVNVVMPFGTNVTNLIPTFTLSTGATAEVNSVVQNSGVTSNNFTTPLVYYVEAEDMSTFRNWTVTVTVEAGSSEAEILTFDIPTQISSTVTSATAHVDVVMPYGTDRSSLTPTITVSPNATIDPVSGTTDDFTGIQNFTVTAQAGNTKTWIVSVTNELNDEAEIISFDMAEQTGPANINSVAGTISIEVANGSNLAFLVPTITISTDASITPASGTGQNFTAPFVYTVTAQDGTTKTWTVTVTEEIVALVYWTFPYNPDDAIADGGIAANISKIISTVGGTSAIAFTYAGASTYSARATAWDNGIDTKYWLVEFSTEGYQDIIVNSKQRSSSTGPRDFKLQYQVGAGAWTNVVSSITLDDNFTAGVVSNITLPNDANNQSSVSLRWIMTSNTSVGSGTVAGTGASRIDDIIINGSVISSDAEILSFTIPSQFGLTAINSGAATVDVVMPYGTDVTALVPSFILSSGAEADITGTPQVSSVTDNDFTNPLVYTVTAEDGTTTKDWTVTVTLAPASTEAEILTFDIPLQVSSTVNSGAATVSVIMPYGTDLTNLIPTITISDYATINPNSGVAQDFSASVVYTVTAQDGTTTKAWTVTVTNELNNEAEILTFDIPAQVSSTITSAAATVDIVVPYGTDVTGLVPTITVSSGATIDPASGVAQDFTSPVVYTVTAENGTTTKDWTVTVVEEDYIDLALASPPSANIDFCDGTATSPIMVTIENTGNTIIAAGEQITMTADIDGTIVNETLTLAADLNPTESLDYLFTATFNLAAFQTYAYTFSLSYTHDMNNTNDAATGNATHISFTVEIVQGDTIELESTDFPYSLTLTDTYDLYEWTDENNNVLSAFNTVMISDFGMYYINVHNSGTGCYAVDSILVTEYTFTDLAILIPPGGNIDFCDGTTTTVVGVLFGNVGSSVIAAGEQIEMTATIDAITYVETLTLTSDLNPGDNLDYQFTGTFDLSAFIGYNYTFSLSYAPDVNTTNDTVTGIATHVPFTTEITGGDTLCLQLGDFPYTLTLTGVADNYEWTDYLHNVISNTSTAVVNDFGWYYIEMWNSTQTCWAEDSIIVFLCVDAESTVAENAVTIYPNPSNGMVFVTSTNPVTYEVTTIDGKTITRNNSAETFNSIDLGNEAKGIYFIKIISNNVTSVHKIVIE